MRKLLLSLALIAPTVAANTLTVEQILELQQARNEAHVAQERVDNSLVLTLCHEDPTDACITPMRQLIDKYKQGVIRLHEQDKRFTERLGGQPVTFGEGWEEPAPSPEASVSFK